MKRLVDFISREPVLTLILVLGLGLRLSQLFDPLVDADSFRQCATASIARNYYEYGYHLFNPRITGWGTIDEPGLWPNEFPLYPYVISIFYQIFGVHEWFGRLLTALFSVAGAYALYIIVKYLDNETTGKFAALWYVIAPQAIYHGRCFHRHPIAISLMLMAIAAYIMWLHKPKWAYYNMMIAFVAIALLMMPPLIIFAIPFLGVNSTIKKRLFFLDWKVLLAIIISLIPAYFWYSWAIQQHGSFSLQSSGRETFRNWTSLAYYGYWWEYDMFRKVWWALWQYTLGPIGLIFGLVGIGIRRETSSLIPLVWVVTIILYYMFDIHPIAVDTHYVYFLLILPSMAWGAGRFMNLIWINANQQSHYFGASLRIILVGLIVFGTIFHWDKMFRPWYKTKEHYIKAAEQIKSHTTKRSRVVMDRFEPAILYYSHRKGLCKNPPDITKENIIRWEKEGATHLAIVNIREFLDNMDLRFHLKATARNVVIDNNIRLYELNYYDHNTIKTETKEYQSLTVRLPFLPYNARLLDMVQVQTDPHVAESIKTKDAILDATHWNVAKKPFYISRTPITKAQWYSMMDQSQLKTLAEPNDPITNISWKECQEFINKLNQHEQGTYRLPTAAELAYMYKQLSDEKVMTTSDENQQNGTYPLLTFKHDLSEWTKTPHVLSQETRDKTQKTPSTKPDNPPKQTKYAIFTPQKDEQTSQNVKFTFSSYDTQTSNLTFRVIKIIE